jgi:hypothetical protein
VYIFRISHFSVLVTALSDFEWEWCAGGGFPASMTNIFQTLDCVFFNSLKKLKASAVGDFDDDSVSHGITKFGLGRRTHRKELKYTHWVIYISTLFSFNKLLFRIPPVMHFISTFRLRIQSWIWSRVIIMVISCHCRFVMTSHG